MAGIWADICGRYQVGGRTGILFRRSHVEQMQNWLYLAMKLRGEISIFSVPLIDNVKDQFHTGIMPNLQRNCQVQPHQHMEKKASEWRKPKIILVSLYALIVFSSRI
jgi:hypothetical protein